jgi:hypothetical protein
MQGYHSNVEMYRDTTEHRNKQKKVGAMPEKYWRSDQPFMMYKTKPKQKRSRMTAEQETHNEVRKKQRK